ncbi:MAG: hypothetical protein LUH14_07260 [Clostridiaceae bacterium]|nr:hypothetical protein [Clostridiaceae bacterium]
MNIKSKLSFLSAVKNTGIILFCSILNIAGFFITTTLQAPFFLDSIGTALCACLLGPVAGSAAGILSFFLSNIIIPRFWAYFLFQVLIAACIYIGYLKTDFNELFLLLFTGIAASIAIVFFSFPLVYFLQDGDIGNIWGDALKDMMEENGIGLPFGCLLGELFVAVPDMVITVLFAFAGIRISKKIKSGGAVSE